MEKNKKLYTCKTLRLCNWLNKKYDILSVVPDKDNSRFSVFLFEDSDEFREYLSKYDNGLSK
jgi:hypothetical protein